MRKVLPIQYPINTTWTWHADTDAVIRNIPSSIEWIYSNYVQLCCFSTDVDRIFIDFELSSFDDCPYLKIQMISRDFISTFSNDVIDFFIKCIDNGYYIYVFVDENVFFKKSNKKFPHELLIYGYDSDMGEFYVADFTFKVGYSTSKVSFNDLEKSYYNIDKSDYAYNYSLLIYTLNYHANYKFDKILFKQGLQCYVDSSFPYEYSRMKNNRNDDTPYTYGLAIYDRIIDYLNYCENQKENIDLRPFHIEYIHKSLMKERVLYLIENKFLHDDKNICESLKTLCEKLLAVRNLCIKYNITINHKLMSDIQLKLSEIKKNEQKILNLILAAIES